MRKQATFAIAAIIFALSMILFGAFSVDKTTASDTRRVSAGPQYAAPLNSFLGVRKLEEVW